MAGRHPWLDGRESQWTPGVGDGQGGLACCSSWGRRESDMTERLNWTELKACFISLDVVCRGERSVYTGRSVFCWGKGSVLQPSAEPSWLVLWLRSPSVSAALRTRPVNTLPRRGCWSLQLKLWMSPLTSWFCLSCSAFSAHTRFVPLALLGELTSVLTTGTLHSSLVSASFEVHLVWR